MPTIGRCRSAILADGPDDSERSYHPRWLGNWSQRLVRDDAECHRCFARATGDLQWIHVDAERAARESPFKSHDGTGSTVAHGFLTLSLLSHWMDATVEVTDRGAGINAGFNRIRFTGPVVVGSRIRARFALASSGPIRGGTKLLWNVSVEREGQSRPVLIAEWLTRVLTAAVPEAASDQRASRSPRMSST